MRGIGLGAQHACVLPLDPSHTGMHYTRAGVHSARRSTRAHAHTAPPLHSWGGNQDAGRALGCPAQNPLPFSLYALPAVGSSRHALHSALWGLGVSGDPLWRDGSSAAEEPGLQYERGRRVMMPEGCAPSAVPGTHRTARREDCPPDNRTAHLIAHRVLTSDSLYKNRFLASFLQWEQSGSAAWPAFQSVACHKSTCWAANYLESTQSRAGLHRVTLLGDTTCPQLG